MSGDATRPEGGDVLVAIERAVAAIRRDPRDARGWSALAAAYFTLGQHDDAVQALERARAIDPADFDSALRHAASLLELGRDEEALAVARDAAAVDPTSADPHFIAGNVHASRGEHTEAADAFARAASLAPRAAGDDAQRATALAHYNRALALDELGRWTDAARACEAALALEPELWPALAQLVFLKRRLCEWDGVDALSARLREAVADEREGITPFSFLAEPATPAEQLRCASTWARSILARSPGIPVGGASAPTAQRRSAAKSVGAEAPPTVNPTRPARMRVGLVSSGFNNHPTALLTVELIERLRESSITTIGFATTASDGGALRGRIAHAFHEFVELDGDAHATMAQRIRDARIDVLFDLRGYGGGSVSEVFAMRPCARQVNWLAYPGTSGAPFIDVMIADSFVVPADAEPHYSERIVRMPHAFQPC
ncbi:MAG TPA: tetratricopeptide repeat protein, partial [Candidatus Saccharimonadia bacterium]|nr:tetratricopeptide repeat protein [Candidatus Saccharimonadia bacterium]